MPYVKQHILISESRHFCNHTLYDERKSTHGKNSRMTVISAVCENIFEMRGHSKNKSCNFTSLGNKCQNKEWTTTNHIINFSLNSRRTGTFSYDRFKNKSFFLLRIHKIYLLYIYMVTKIGMSKYAIYILILSFRSFKIIR